MVSKTRPPARARLLHNLAHQVLAVDGITILHAQVTDLA